MENTTKSLGRSSRALSPPCPPAPNPAITPHNKTPTRAKNLKKVKKQNKYSRYPRVFLQSHTHSPLCVARLSYTSRYPRGERRHTSRGVSTPLPLSHPSGSRALFARISGDETREEHFFASSVAFLVPFFFFSWL